MAKLRMSTPAETGSSHFDRGDWISIAGLSALAIALTGSTWQRWSSPLVDVGRELYTAWAISQGAHLYEDIWLPRGPLSSYWNGLVFAVFGDSMLTLAVANLVILTAALAILYTVIRRDHGTGTATVASFLLLSVFAFGRYDTMGNYNFVLPYAHEVTHGLVLSLFAMALMLRALRSVAHLQAIGAGFVLGLVLLTKQEIAVAAVVATVVCVASERALAPHQRARVLGWIGLGAVPPLLIALLSLGAAPFAMMWNGAIVDGIRDSPFYQANLGLDRPAEHLINIGVATLALGIEVLALALVGRFLRGASIVRVGIATGIYVALHLLLFAYGPISPWRYWITAPMLLLPVSGSVAVLALWRRIGALDRGWADAFVCWLAIYASVMLLKLGLFTRIHYYGFAQALPAAMLLVVVLLGVAPQWLARFGVEPRFVRGALACLIASFGLYSLSLQRGAYAPLIVDGGAGADTFRRAKSAERIQNILVNLQQRISPNESLLVLPEGVFFNYMLRVPSPTPHISFMPFELLLTGERRIVADLEANPPDHVLLLRRDVKEYGFEAFGAPGFGDQIIAWLREHYSWPEGARPQQTILLKRQDARPTAVTR